MATMLKVFGDGAAPGAVVDAVCVDCAARAGERARGSLDLPERQLIVGAEYGGGELLTASGASVAAEGSTLTDDVVDYGDLRLALRVASAMLVARTVTGLGEGRAPGA